MRKLKLDLEKVPKNKIDLFAAFRRAAWDQFWTSDDVNQVLDPCYSMDLNDLYEELSQHCEPPAR